MGFHSLHSLKAIHYFCYYQCALRELWQLCIFGYQSYKKSQICKITDMNTVFIHYEKWIQCKSKASLKHDEVGHTADNPNEFEPVNENAIRYTFRIENQINFFLRKLKSAGSITTDPYNSLYVSGSAPGVFYGLPKIHKPDFKNMFHFRRIFSSYNSPSF